MTQPPIEPTVEPTVEVAIAILCQGNRFLLQLRDDIPGILYPGHWTFFGGHLEPGEDPFTGIQRELQEEIGYVPPQLALFDRRQFDNLIRNVFWADLTVPLSDLELNEGWDMDLANPADIQRGYCYSAKAGEERPIGGPHRQLLLDFMAQKPLPS